MKKYYLCFIQIASFLFMDIVFRLVFSHSMSLISTLFIVGLAVFLFCFNQLFNEKTKKVLFFVELFAVTFLYCMQLCLKRMFNFYFDFGLLAAADQLAPFWKDTLKHILRNSGYILLFFVPFILCLVFVKKLDFKEKSHRGISLVLAIILALGFSFLVKVDNSPTEVLIINEGVLTTFFNGFKEKPEEEILIDLPAPALEQTSVVEEVVEESSEEQSEAEEIVEVIVEEPTYQIYNIDFSSIPASGYNTINKLNEYFSNSTGTLTNEMTGIFEGKNLVLFMGESFNSMAVFEDLTPTLYKLVNEGFRFTNYYSTSYNSTLGGEFQLLNGMFAISDALEKWKSGTNDFPYSIVNLFKEEGYATYAYHDHQYNYMDRNKYLNAYGFENYKGCRNGLEQVMKCTLMFESDLEMVEGTMSDFIDEDQFFTYYVTVSGHGPYTYDSSSNVIGKKYRDYIQSLGYDYSQTVMAYLSSMVELDKAVETLMNQLEAKGKLDDTVIVIAADHYPYYLDARAIEELSGVDKEAEIEVCENDLIIYNSATEQVVTDKACNTMDVLATLYNLFGLDYDSRLIVGKDIFSEAPGFAIFGNGSWVSDVGTYYAHLGKFVPNEGIEVSDDYFETANNYVKTQRALTNMIFQTNYYGYIDEYVERESE